jgi:hypothetical protein
LAGSIFRAEEISIRELEVICKRCRYAPADHQSKSAPRGKS